MHRTARRDRPSLRLTRSPQRLSGLKAGATVGGAIAQGMLKLLVKLRVLWVIVVAALFLSGCVHYDVDVRFQDQTHGQLIQHIRLGEQLTSFNRSVTQDWLQSIQQRSRQLGGSTKRLANQELEVTIPFSNSKDLEKKFNQFFQASLQGFEAGETAETADVELPKLVSNLRMEPSNFLLVERNFFSYDLDLRSLGVLSSGGGLLVSPGSILDLEFSLTTPWGVRSAKAVGSGTANPLDPTIQKFGRQLVWTLRAGEINHLEAVFWEPSPVGIGTTVIILFIAIGFAVKSQVSTTP